MEFRSSLVNLMENHVCVKKFEFEERDPTGNVRSDAYEYILRDSRGFIDILIYSIQHFFTVSIKVRMCLDGDPVEAGRKLAVTHIPKAWNIVAQKQYPNNVAQEFIVPRPETECAKLWLSQNRIPQNMVVPKVIPKKSGRISMATLFFVGGLVTAAAVGIYLSMAE